MENPPLNAVYPVVFIGAIMIEAGDGQVSNGVEQGFYVAIGVTVNGKREIPESRRAGAAASPT